jgi:hypothetical protein
VGPSSSNGPDDPTANEFNSLSVKWVAIEYGEWLIGLPYSLDPEPLLQEPRTERDTGRNQIKSRTRIGLLINNVRKREDDLGVPIELDKLCIGQSWRVQLEGDAIQLGFGFRLALLFGFDVDRCDVKFRYVVTKTPRRKGDRGFNVDIDLQ